MCALHSSGSPDGSEPQREAMGQPAGTGMGWGGGGALGCLGTPQAKCTSSSQAAHLAHCHRGSKAQACHSSLQPCCASSPVFQNSILATGGRLISDLPNQAKLLSGG